jgi:flagella basal body P-ring formation protein FlgA
MMKTLPHLAVLAALACAGLCCAAEEAPWRIGLKEKAVVRGEVIRLTDVAELDEDVPEPLRQLCLGNAPWPGHVREISRVLVRVRLASAGWPAERCRFEGSDCCAVTLDSLRIEPERIVEAARAQLASHFPEGGPEVQIELLRPVEAVLVAAGGEAPRLRPSLYGSGPPAGTVRVDVNIVREGSRLERVPVSFLVRLHDRVAAARRNIAAGEKLSTQNVQLVRREVTGVYGSYIRTLEELERKEAAGPILAGQTLTRRNVRDVEKPVVIERNQHVFLVVETATLRIVMLGRALARARAGGVARAENMNTGREVTGIALEGGTIRVPMEGRSHDKQ